MDFNDFWESQKDEAKSFPVRFRPIEGSEEIRLPDSGKVYLFVERAESWDEGSRTGWHSEDDLLLDAGKVVDGHPVFPEPDDETSVELGYRDLRLHLSPAFSMKPKNGVATADDPNVDEYGIEPGKVYWALCMEESYHLPPRGEGGAPQRRTKRLLRIADAPFEGKPETPLIPLFRHWTY